MQRAEALRAMLQRPVRPDAEHMWGLMEETLSGHEEEVCRLKREKMELSKLVNAAWSPQVVLHTAEELPPEQQEEEEPGPPHIKEEEEEFPVKTEHDDECAQWSQLHQRQTEEEREAEAVASTSTQQMETQADGEDWGVSEAASSSDPAAALQPAGAEQLFSSHASQTDTEDSDGGREKAAEPPSGSQTLEPGHTLRVGSTLGCKVCGGPFLSSLSLLIHARLHAEDCGLCGKHLEPSETLELHFQTHRTCGVCGKVSASISALERHMRVHARRNSVACAVCGEGFPFKGDLRRHLRTHSGAGPFGCSLCGKGFHSRYNLHIHTRLHTGEKPFVCSLCGKTFNQKANLNAHVRLHAGGKPFGCGVCGKGFTKQRYVRTHRCEKGQL